jgi:hypothetical protein
MNLHQNPIFLREKYWNEGLTCPEIGKLTNKDYRTILYWMEKLNISRRSKSLTNHLIQRNENVNLPKEAKEFINGELLGDGSINQRSIYSACYSHGSKYKEYLEWLISKFQSWGIKCMRIRKKECENYTGYYFATHDYPIFIEFRKRFYPNGKKIIPKNMDLSPITLRQFYIGDGGLIKNKSGKFSIKLYTYGFSIKDVLFLMIKLKELDIETTRQKSNIINIGVKSAPKFLNYIGECPEEIKDIYGYKWF